MDWTPVSSQSLPLTPVEPRFSSTQVPVSSGPSASPAALSVSQPRRHTAMQHQLPRRPAWLPPSPALTVSASPVSPVHTSAAKQQEIESTTPHQSLLPSDKNLQHKSKNAPKLALHSKPSSSRTSSISMGSTALDPDVTFLPKSPATATLSTPSGNKGSTNTIVTGLTLANPPPQSGTSQEQDVTGATDQSMPGEGGAGPSGKEGSAHPIARAASAEVLTASTTLESLPTSEPTKTTKRSACDDEDSKSEARVDDSGRPSDRKRMKLSNDGAAPTGVDELGMSSEDGDVAMTTEDHAASASGVQNQVTASPSEPTLTPSNLLDSRGAGVQAAPGQTFILCGPHLTCTTPSVPVNLDSKTVPMEVGEAPRPADTTVLKQSGEVTRRSPVPDVIAGLSTSVMSRSPIPENPSESAYSGGEGSNTKENEATQADSNVTQTRSLSDTARSAPPEDATPLVTESTPELAQAGTHNVTPEPASAHYARGGTRTERKAQRNRDANHNLEISGCNAPLEDEELEEGEVGANDSEDELESSETEVGEVTSLEHQMQQATGDITNEPDSEHQHPPSAPGPGNMVKEHDSLTPEVSGLGQPEDVSTPSATTLAALEAPPLVAGANGASMQISDEVCVLNTMVPDTMVQADSNSAADGDDEEEDEEEDEDPERAVLATIFDVKDEGDKQGVLQCNLCLHTFKEERLFTVKLTDENPLMTLVDHCNIVHKAAYTRALELHSARIAIHRANHPVS
ncbi:hypothetical protein FRB95_013208 [Tulasnella sp. JGI-2019a]|nr:hypothetical protein FRB95_013208 [Tulasnella sp. JGI-2019a]